MDGNSIDGERTHRNPTARATSAPDPEPSISAEKTQRNTAARPAPAPEPDASIDGLPTMGGAPEGSLGRIDRYVLKRKLGQGGFGAVYLAEDTEAGIEVALKALPGLIANSPEELERVRANFALVQRLAHPNIATLKHLHKVVSADRTASEALRAAKDDYLVVMECAEGSTLSSWRHLFQEGKVPVGQALVVCAQIAEALDYAHQERIVHRDIKPANVMVAGEGDSLRVKVLDFGLAAEIRSSMGRVSTDTGETSGTRPYMSPEQWAGKRQGAPTDQYALAVLFHELVSGEVPFASAFETNDPIVMLNAATNLVPDPLPELTKRQNAAMLRALAKNPEERFASCGEFVAALGGAKFTTKARSPRKGKWGWLLALVLLAGLGFGGWQGWTRYQAVQTARIAAEKAAAERVRDSFMDLLSANSELLNEYGGDPYSATLGLRERADHLLGDGSFIEAEHAFSEALSSLESAVAVAAAGRQEALGRAEAERLSRLEAERRERLASLAASAAAALDRHDYSGANRLVGEMLGEEPQNREALGLRERIDREAGPAILAEERGRAETLMNNDNVGGVSREDGFGRLIDEARTTLNAAEHLQEADPLLALPKYREAVGLAKAILTLDAERGIAQQARKNAERAQLEASGGGAKQHAAELWRRAETESAKAAEAYGGGASAGSAADGIASFAEATRNWRQAAEDYGRAQTHAEGVQRVSQARIAYESLWNECPWRQTVLVPDVRSADRQALVVLLEQHGGPKWLSAKEALDKAGVLEQEEKWAAAADGIGEAARLLTEAVVHVDLVIRTDAYGRTMATGKDDLARQDWGNAEKHFGLALAVPGYAEDQDALVGRQTARLNRALAEARRAKDAGNWAQVKESLRGLEQEDSAAGDSVETLRNLRMQVVGLLAEAAEHDEPILRIVSTVDNQEVAGSVVVVDGIVKGRTPLCLDKGLEAGRRYLVEVSRPPADGLVFLPLPYAADYTAERGENHTIRAEFRSYRMDGSVPNAVPLALIKAGQYEVAASLIDQDSDAAWKTAFQTIASLHSSIRRLREAGSEDGRMLAAKDVCDAMLAVASQPCPWYDRKSPWYDASHSAVNDLHLSLRDWLDQDPGVPATTFVLLANRWQQFGQLIGATSTTTKNALCQGRYSRDASSLLAAHGPIAWLQTTADDVDAETGWPLAVRLNTADRNLDSMEFLYIPAGSCVVGEVGGETTSEDNCIRVDISGFYISKFEVSNREYQAFCDDEAGHGGSVQRPEYLMRRNSEFGSPEQPVIQVSYREAQQFSRWVQRQIKQAGGQVECRLPTQCEFEKAGRGWSLFRYPWGYDFDSRRCFHAATSPRTTQASSAASGDVSFHGVMNLAGNLSEWCLDDWDTDLARLPSASRDPVIRTGGAAFKTVKGGNYTSHEELPDVMQLSTRNAYAVNSQESAIGFRIVLVPQTVSARQP